MDSTDQKMQCGDAIIWLPIGIALGAGIGSYLNEMSTGMSIGMMVGATISMLIDYRSGKRSIIWPFVGFFTIVWTLMLVLVEQT